MESDTGACDDPGDDGTDRSGPTRSRAARFTRRRRSTIRVLAVVGLLAFGLSVMVVLTEVINPVANERALEPAGSPEAELGADRWRPHGGITGLALTTMVWRSAARPA
jgi:hypothetical protein